MSTTATIVGTSSSSSSSAGGGGASSSLSKTGQIFMNINDYNNHNKFYDTYFTNNDYYRQHNYHEDIINRHRQMMNCKNKRNIHNYNQQQQPPKQQVINHQSTINTTNNNTQMINIENLQSSSSQPHQQFSSNYSNDLYSNIVNNQNNQIPMIVTTTTTATSGNNYLQPSTSTNLHSIMSPITIGNETTTATAAVTTPKSSISPATAVVNNNNNNTIFHYHPNNQNFNYHHQRQSSMQTSNKKHLLFNKMKRTIGKNFLNDERDRKYYADMYTCMPPPLFILSITVIEILFFTYYSLINQQNTDDNNDNISMSRSKIPIDSLFIYRPDKKNEIWRFFLYMILHANWLHLLFNIIIQLLIGLPLEMVHGSIRIGTIYMSGILAGSLATSIFDPNCLLIGASGGVYALLAAHLSNVLLNYDHLELGLLRVLGVFLIATIDISIAIYNRYLLPPTSSSSSPTMSIMNLNQLSSSSSSSSISYVAHLAGALAGLTIGLLVLKNFEQKLHEQLLWWMALGVYTACIIFALIFNIIN